MNFRNCLYYHSSKCFTLACLATSGVIFLAGCVANSTTTTTQIPFPTPIPQTVTSFLVEITYTLRPSVALTTNTPEPSATNTSIPRIYVFPVQPVKYTGYAEGYAAHGYPAIDIFAPAGWAFVAVTDGMVDFVSYTDTWDPVTDDPASRGGLSVAIIGDDGLRYYGSHLSSIADGISPGMRVLAGQTLGYVGKSGNARERGTHLHFGISRPTYPEDWRTRRGEIDPYAYLNAWREGINISPVYSTPTPKVRP
jgi:murein DD-endopeptidase MepM/ murein hydrolase activator NlpD